MYLHTTQVPTGSVSTCFHQEGDLLHTGQVGSSLDVEDAVKAAKLCGLNLVAQMREACDGNLDRVKKVSLGFLFGLAISYCLCCFHFKFVFFCFFFWCFFGSTVFFFVDKKNGVFKKNCMERSWVSSFHQNWHLIWTWYILYVFFCLGRVGGDVNINLKLQDYNIHIPIIYLLNIFFPQYGIRNQW